MKKKKCMPYIEYFLRHLNVAFVVCALYYVFLFVHIPGASVMKSKLMYFGCNQVIWFIFSLITPARKRNEYNVVFNVALAYIPYFLITYSSAYNKYIGAFVAVIVVLSALYFCIVVFKKIKNKQNAKRIVRHRVGFALNGIRAIAGALACVLLGVSVLFSIYGVQLAKSDDYALEGANSESAEQWTVKNNIDTVKLLREDDWKKLSVDEKLEVLKVIRNIEVAYLGIPHKVHLSAGVMDDGVLGYYSHKEHSVVINHRHIESSLAEDVLETLCHEIFHAYEHNEVELFNSVDAKYKNMIVFSNSQAYEDDFKNYVSADEDLIGYITQVSEINSAKYAKSSVKEYYRLIDKYLNEEKAV